MLFTMRNKMRCIALLVCLLSPSTAVFAQETSFDGLKLTKSDDFDEVYVAPDMSLDGYNKMILEPGTVSFRKNWERDYRRDHKRSLRDKDLERIKSGTINLLMDVFTKAVETNGNFALTTEKGEDTLLVRPSIIKLDVYAPDVDRSTRQKNYVREAGVATLYLEVFDSNTGEILARVVDKKRGRDHGWMREANRATNTQEAKIIFKSWAKRLNEQLAKIK